MPFFKDIHAKAFGHKRTTVMYMELSKGLEKIETVMIHEIIGYKDILCMSVEMSVSWKLFPN